MIVRILDKAERDIQQTADYYNEESPGLGYEFLDELLKTIGRIQQIRRRGKSCHAGHDEL